MLADCLKVFEKIYQDKGDKLLLDAYVPADGLYVIIYWEDGQFRVKKTVNIKYNKKTKELEGADDLFFKNICYYDYSSKLIDMNKPIDIKKIIQGNNYLSFIVKKESLSNGKLTNEIIDTFYETLSEPKKKYQSKPKSLELYESIEQAIGEPNKNEITKVKDWIKQNIFSLEQLGIEVTGKDYLKIFFELESEEQSNYDNFDRESRRYLIPNIYNSNDYNITIDETIYGVPNNNMGLNAKKPYLVNKTREIETPSLVTQEYALTEKKFFDYLMNNAAKNNVNVYIDIENSKFKFYQPTVMCENNIKGYFLRMKKGKEVEIHDFDIVPNYSYQIKCPIEIKNVLDIDLSNSAFKEHKYGYINTKAELQDRINDILFSKYLINNYFVDAKDMKINDSILKNCILLSRDVIFNYIYKGINNGLFKMLDNIALRLIKNSIMNGYNVKAIYQFNFKWSLKQYCSEGRDETMDILTDIRTSLREKINLNETTSLVNDDEYYFAVGQLVSYFLSLSKAGKKNLSLVNPFINASNNEVVKMKLKQLFKKYNYAISDNSKRIKNMYTMVSGYQTTSKVNQDLIIAGYLSSSLIYEKGSQGGTNYEE